MRYFLLIFFYAYVGIALCVAQEEKISKCKMPKGIGGQYKPINVGRFGGSPKKIDMFVVIKPSNITKEYLTEFAKRVKAEYCHEDFIGASIFDNKEAFKGWFTVYVESSGKIDKRRAAYIFDRLKGEDGFEFSTKPGNSIHEVQVDLSKK